MKVTRVLQADAPKSLRRICKAAGFLRADLWRRYGGLKNVGKSNNDIRKEIHAGQFYAKLQLDGTIRAATALYVIDDILMYKAAAKQKVRQAIFQRTGDGTERKRLFTLLKADRWLEDSYLRRMMRRHFEHGRSRVDSQFIVRSDKVSAVMVDNRLTITIKVAKRYGADIVLTTTSSGKNVDLKGKNLRIILKDGFTEIHYATEKAEGRPHGDQELGVDKGYTEAFVDSDGQHYGQEFGVILAKFSDKATKTGRARNKLHHLEKRHREAGHTQKADNIRKNNLGRKKLEARRNRIRAHLRTVAFKATHQVYDKAKLVASEDLTAVFANKRPWKRYNKRMSSWAKGVLAEALDSVAKQRGARHHLVNCAYTSQMDSCTGLLEGKRVGDKFYRTNGDVLQADHNAARNVLARLSDPDINRFTPYQEVKRILLARSSGGTDRQEARVGAQLSRQPCADKSRLQFELNWTREQQEA